MKFLCILVTASVLLTACTIGPGGICGPNIPAIYCASKEERDKVFHPKTYGEYWVKPDMTKENWRQDWTAYGGRGNGQYSTNNSPASDALVLLAADRKKANELGICMQSKGYEFRGEP